MTSLEHSDEKECSNAAVRLIPFGRQYDDIRSTLRLRYLRYTTRDTANRRVQVEPSRNLSTEQTSSISS